MFCLFLAVNMVNGMSVNGLGEVSMDTTQTVISNTLIALGKLPKFILEEVKLKVIFDLFRSDAIARSAAA